MKITRTFILAPVLILCICVCVSETAHSENPFLFKVPKLSVPQLSFPKFRMFFSPHSRELGLPNISNMPIIVPDPHIDFKILKVPINPTVDYQILTIPVPGLRFGFKHPDKLKKHDSPPIRKNSMHIINPEK